MPGYHGERQDAKFLKEQADEIGYPVLIKPAAGGGGSGMRRVDKHADFDDALEGAVREAEAAFGSSRGADREIYRQRRATSRFRCLATGTATSSISASATARCSAAIRR